MRARSMRLVILAGALLLVALTRHMWVAPPAVDPDHPFDTARALASLERALGDERPHPIDSDASDGVIARWVEAIRDAGFAPKIDEAFHCNTNRWGTVCGRVRNIGFWVGEPGDDAVMLASHHDSVPAGPGAADDGMGVAASLEIARNYKTLDLSRPLYVLITDGEEIGLLGASRFVEHSPVAARIGAVVSMEARGNRGTATMFETSTPNGRDLRALGPSGTLRPLTNSMAADIYERMPNGTDVTEFLKLPIDAANYSMIGRYAHYHSPQDTLANLDPRSVFHVGASAMAAVDGFMGVETSPEEGQFLYTDILRRTVLAQPAWTRWPVLGVAFLLCAITLIREPAGRLRALVGPPFVILGGTLAAVLAGLAVGAVRPESAYGAAHPWALRGLFACISLLAGLGVARGLYQSESWRAFLAGAWLWLTALGLLVAWLLPGGAVLYVLPAVIVSVAAVLLLLGRTTASAWVFALATAAFILLTQPTVPLAEAALFIESSAPFVLLLLLALATALQLVWRKPGGSRPVLALLALASVGFAVAAVLVPAHSSEHPQRLSLVHMAGDDWPDSYYRISGDAGDPVPDAMQAVTRFGRPDDDDLQSYARLAGAPPLRRAGVTVTREDAQSLRLQSTDADELTLRLRDMPEGLGFRALGGFVFDGPAPQSVECHGRACRDIVLTLDTSEGATLVIDDVAYGLDVDSAALLSARPAWVTPRHTGDRRLVRRVVPLAAEE